MLGRASLRQQQTTMVRLRNSAGPSPQSSSAATPLPAGFPSGHSPRGRLALRSGMPAHAARGAAGGAALRALARLLVWCALFVPSARSGANKPQRAVPSAGAPTVAVPSGPGILRRTAHAAAPAASGGRAREWRMGLLTRGRRQRRPGRGRGPCHGTKEQPPSCPRPRARENGVGLHGPIRLRRAQQGPKVGPRGLILVGAPSPSLAGLIDLGHFAIGGGRVGVVVGRGGGGNVRVEFLFS